LAPRLDPLGHPHIALLKGLEVDVELALKYVENLKQLGEAYGAQAVESQEYPQP